jgi:hypothetical protein
MTFETYHITIKREVIRAFALADEWIDAALDLQFTHSQFSKSTVRHIAILTEEVRCILDAIVDYRFCEKPKCDLLHVQADDPRRYAVFKAVAGTIPAETIEGIDLYEVRSRLRGVLLECLLLLDVPEENRGCEVSIDIGERTHIHIIDLVRMISGEMMHRIEQLDATPKNTA